MAVTLVGSIHFYIGLSTDIKPLTGLKAGSVFRELDTGLDYRLDNTGAWQLDKGNMLSVGEYRSGVSDLRRLLEQILLELKATNKANEIDVNDL